MATRPESPAGETAEASAARRSARSTTYRERHDARASFRELAWLVIRSRSQAGLTQEQLANRAGLTTSQVAHIERGGHGTTLDTLQRIATALDKRLVLGFETVTGDGRRRRELTAL